MSDEDEKLARMLQEEFYAEILQDDVEANHEVTNLLPKPSQYSPKKSLSPKFSVVAPEWEDLDPTPDLHALFIQFNDQFFWGRLSGCEVKWSPRMTLCAGVCTYQYRSGFCSIRLSVPLLKLRPRKDLVETLLHEMIHAYLFVTDGNDDHDGHGPAFHEHMYRINKKTGANISVYHSFHDEVDNYRTHWWQCDGPCRQRRPFFGIVKRAMNRAPGPNDRWWGEHQRTCGGTYTKIKEPDNYGRKKAGGGEKRKKEDPAPLKGQRDIRSFTKVPKAESGRNPLATVGGNLSNCEGPKKSGGGRGNIFGFGGTSFASPGSSKQPSTSFSNFKAKEPSMPNSTNIGGNVTGGTSKPPQKSAVQDQLRMIWANKFNQQDAPTSSTKTSSHDDKEIIEKVDKVPCPVCSTQIASTSINQHLDQCLVSPKDAKNHPECPICYKAVHSDEMNLHLEYCTSK